MRTGLLSIHEPYADAIFAKTKKYEFRRKAPRLDGPTRFLIYVPGPRQELAGEMIVTHVIALPPEQLWRLTKDAAGIPKDRFMAYFEGRDVAYALVIKRAKRFRRPKRLGELRKATPGGFWPPQFLRWVPPALLAALLA